MFQSYDELLEIIQYVTLDELLSKGLDPLKADSEGIYVLNPVCKALDVGLAKQLIQVGADVNALSDDGFTPLLSAIECSHHDPESAVRLITLLLDSGADIEGRGDWDKTPFLKSCTRGVLEVTRLLVERGCDIHATAKEIGGLMGAREFADVHSNNSEFKKYVNKLLSS